MPVNASPTSIALISMLLVPDALDDQADRAGLDVPVGQRQRDQLAVGPGEQRGRTARPGRRAAISGELHGELLDAVADRCDRGQDPSARWCPARCTPGPGRPCRARPRRARSTSPRISLAAAWPSPAAAIAVEPPRAASPPVKTPSSVVSCEPAWSRTIVPHLEVFSRGSESLMIGLAALPSAMITRSACMVSVRPVAIGRRRPDSSGSPSSMTSSVAAVTKPVLSSPRNSDGRAQLAQRDALLEGVVQLLDAGGHLRAGAPVDDRDVAAEAPGGAGGVHRGVAAADDQHLLALGLGQRGLVVGAQALHEVDPGEELVGAHHVEQVLAGDVHEPRQPGTGADEDPVEAGVAQVLQRGGLADHEVLRRTGRRAGGSCRRRRRSARWAAGTRGCRSAARRRGRGTPRTR